MKVESGSDVAELPEDMFNDPQMVVKRKERTDDAVHGSGMNNGRVRRKHQGELDVCLVVACLLGACEEHLHH